MSSAKQPTEAALLRRIEGHRKRQERAETDEADAIVAGYPERTIAALRRVAAQQLWKRRKLTKQVDDMRAAALLTGGAP